MLQTAWLAQLPADAVSSTGGSRTRTRQGLSLAALPVCVPCHTQRPVRDSNPSHLLDRQAVTPASSQGVSRQSVQRESNPHVRHGKAAGSRYIMGAITSSRGGRIRTHTGPVWRRPCCRYTTPLFSEARGTRTLTPGLRDRSAAANT